MLLREYMRQNGLLTVSEFRARMQISSQHASRLWNGYDRPGAKMVLRIHEQCGVPLKGLLQLETRKERQAREADLQPV